MTKDFLVHLVILVGIGILGTFLQEYLAPQQAHGLFYPAWKIYTFQVAASVFLAYGLGVVRKMSFQSTGFAFIGFTFLKMVGSIGFLYPVIASDKSEYILDVATFMIPYFLFLFLDVVYAVRLLGEKSGQIS